MTDEKFRELMDGDSEYSNHKGVCRITAGLNIIGKYLPQFGITAAEHDIVYSVDVDQIADTNITEEEVTTLRELGWFIEGDIDSLAHFA
jgi:hypothetical protein